MGSTGGTVISFDAINITTKTLLASGYQHHFADHTPLLASAEIASAEIASLAVCGALLVTIVFLCVNEVIFTDLKQCCSYHLFYMFNVISSHFIEG